MKPFLELVNLILLWLNRLISMVASILMVFLTVVVFGEVLSRYVFKTPFVFTTELTALLFPWMVFLGAVAVTRDNEHLSINLVKESLPNVAKRFLTYFEKAVMIVFSIFMVKSSLELTEVFANQSLRTIDISRAWPYYSMVVSFSLMALVILLQVIVMAFENKDKRS